MPPQPAASTSSGSFGSAVSDRMTRKHGGDDQGDRLAGQLAEQLLAQVAGWRCCG